MNRVVHATLGILLTVLALCPPAGAHDLSVSYSKLTLDGVRVHVTFTLNLADLHQGPNMDLDRNGEVTMSELDAGIDRLFATIRSHWTLLADNREPLQAAVDKYSPLSITDAADLVIDNVIRIEAVYIFDHAPSALRVTSAMPRITQENHRHLMSFGEGDDTYQAVLDGSAPSVDIDADGQTLLELVAQFVELGIEHIFTGYDHLAFLVGLLLLTTTFVGLVKVVTSFTVAHSITLALAAFGIVALPPQLIESLIALSIAYVAIENFTGKVLMNRWKITFLFGLVHGFGFANVLQEMDLSRGSLALSLFSFNAGVEIGQIVFVGLLFPVLYALGRTRWKEQVLSAASLVIMCLGFYWFVQRAFLS